MSVGFWDLKSDELNEKQHGVIRIADVAPGICKASDGIDPLPAKRLIADRC